MNLEKLYQQTIMDYNNNEFKYDIKDPTDVERGHNHSCGDDLTLVIKTKGEYILDASFIGTGCAISTASTAMLTSIIKNKKIEYVKELVEIFFEMMKGNAISEDKKNLLEDAAILEITKDMPARIKCSTLSWHSLKIILEKY